jgi:2-dehydropantoate 2-reductase
MTAVVEQRILILGAGAIGGITAALMQGSVRRVVVVGSGREHIDLVRDPGLRLDRLGEVRHVPLEAYGPCEDIAGEFDFCLIAVKAPALESALEPVVRRGAVETFVSLGNGLVHERIAAIVGGDRLIVATVEWGATNLGPGHVRQTSENPIVLGELDGTIRSRTRRLARALAAVAEVKVTTNIAGQLWSKLVLNSALSGLSVIGGCNCAEVVSDPHGGLALRQLWSEGYWLGIRQGLTLEPILGMDPAELASEDPAVFGPALQRVVDESGPTRASMLQDIERGRLTEVDVINGAVVARARALGRDAPRNRRVLALVHGFERGEIRPSRHLFAEISGPV